MEQSRIKNTSRNLVYAVIFQVVKVGLVFIGRIVLAQMLGTEYLGINGLFSNILSILSLADLGMTTALMYSLYKPLAEHDEVKISQYMNCFKKLYRIIAIVIGTIGILLIPFLKYLVNLPNEMPHIYLYYILLLINSVVSYLFVYKTTLISADQKMYIINKYDTIFQFILFVFQMTILIFTKNFTLYLVANIICTVGSNLLKVKKTEEIYPFLKKNKMDILPKTERKDLFTNVYSLFFYRLGAVIQGHTDNILISIFVGTIYVGYYSNYSAIITAAITFITMVFTSLKASVGNYIISKSKEDQLKMFSILEGFCSICFIILIPDFIQICFGMEYVLSFEVLICIVLDFYTSHIRQTLWAYRETTGIFKKTRYVTMITAIINIVLSIILGYYFGVIGIIGATVIARMMCAWWIEPIIIFRDYFNSSPIPYFVTYIKRMILVTVICIATYVICDIIPSINLYISFIIKSIICLIIPTFIIGLIYRKSEAAMYIKENLLKKVGKSYEK